MTVVHCQIRVLIYYRLGVRPCYLRITLVMQVNHLSYARSKGLSIKMVPVVAKHDVAIDYFIDAEASFGQSRVTTCSE